MNMNDGFVSTNKGFGETEETSTGLQVINGQADDGSNYIINLGERNVSYCTMIPQNEEEQDLLFTAMNNPEKRISDCINMEIEVKDIFVEVVFCTDQYDPSIKHPCPRTVLIDTDGVGYQAVSLGIYSAVKKMLDTYGVKLPNGTVGLAKPKKFRVIQITKDKKSLLTFNPVISKKTK